MKKARVRKFFVFSILSVVIIAVLVYFCHVLPTIKVECSVKARRMISQAVNNACYDVLTKNKRDEIVLLMNNNDAGNLHLNTNEVNRLALEICIAVQNTLIPMKKMQISAHLGTMSGIVLFSNIGPRINIDIVPLGVVCYDYEVITKSIGINQVNYRIVLNVITTINLLIPGSPMTEKITTPVLVADCIVSGKVPNVYLGTRTYDLNP